MLLSGYGTWPFPPPPSPFSLSYEELSHCGRERSLLVVDDESVKATYELKTTAGDPLVAAVTSGRFRETPEAFASSVFGSLAATQGQDQYLVLHWKAPTVKRTGDQNAVVSVSARSGRTSGSVQLQLSWRNRWPECTDDRPPTVTASTAKTIAAVDPPSGIYKQSDNTVSLNAPEKLTLVFGINKPVDPLEEWDLPADVREMLDTVWRQALLFGPWIIAFVWFRRKTASHAWWPPAPERTQYVARHLLAGALVTVGAMVLNWLSSRIQKLLPAESSLDSIWLPDGLPTTVAAIVGLLFLWSATFRPDLQRKGGFWRRFWYALVFLAALLAAGLAFSSPPDPFTRTPPEAIRHGAAAAGLILTVAGAVTLSRQTNPGRGRLLDGLCTAGLVIAVALASTTYSVVSQAVSALLTAPVIIGFAAVLLWACFTSAHARQTWPGYRPRWILPAIIVLAASFALSAEVSKYALFPVSPYDAVRLSFAAEPFLRVGLIFATLSVLWVHARSSSAKDFHRTFTVGCVALLLLRPEITLIGLPLSFAVGLLLTAWVLVERSPVITGRNLRGNTGSQTQAAIAVLAHQRAARTAREVRHALRKRLHSAELPPDKAGDIARTVQDALAETRQDRQRPRTHDALGWAGTADPWRRGVLGAAASTVVGIVFSIPLLAQSLSEFDLRGSGPAVALLNTLLAFRFPLYGFVFGYFLPYVRGGSGFAKAARLFVVLSVSESIAILLPYNPNTDIRGALAVLLVQTAMLCAVLGIGADLLSLRLARGGVEDLADLYNMNRVSLWASGLAASAVTALVTGLLGAALTAAAASLLPPAPPPVVQPQSPPDTEANRADG
ncbi:hypothetical protein ACFQ36_09495 [Arthrobacter sp. GCM10027362]|uniref:hypothetical protein n=1 Tax=Arthrobacter sp. GCM10027362 TaxID=3273379 RepID=UPI00362C4C77